ncbi:DUF2933 domain-containing protein [Cupriavidus basilensis]
MKAGNSHLAQPRNGVVRHFLRFPWILVVLGMASAAVILGSQHWNHVVSWLPFAILFLCPMMHFFHGDTDSTQAERRARENYERIDWRAARRMTRSTQNEP